MTADDDTSYLDYIFTNLLDGELVMHGALPANPHWMSDSVLGYREGNRVVRPYMMRRLRS